MKAYLIYLFLNIHGTIFVFNLPILGTITVHYRWAPKEPETFAIDLSGNVFDIHKLLEPNHMIIFITKS